MKGFFTDDARKALQLANREAQRWNHGYIGPEHILLGLIGEGSIGPDVLAGFRVELRAIRVETEKMLQRGTDAVIAAKLPMTPRAKNVIEFSLEEAQRLNHDYVGTGHILLGLLHEQEGVAAQALMNLGLELEKVRKQVASGQCESG